MLISVFLSLVSCHLGSLTIVSLPHILLLQLALSVVGQEMAEQRTVKNDKTFYRIRMPETDREMEKDKGEEMGEWTKQL